MNSPSIEPSNGETPTSDLVLQRVEESLRGALQRFRDNKKEPLLGLAANGYVAVIRLNSPEGEFKNTLLKRLAEEVGGKDNIRTTKYDPECGQMVLVSQDAKLKLKLEDLRPEGSDYELSLMSLTYKDIKDVRLRVSATQGQPQVEISRIEFEDGTFVGIDGQALLEAFGPTQPNLDDETIRELYELENDLLED